MDNLLEYKGWIVSTVFILLFLIERFSPAVQYKLTPIKRIIKNMSFWPINIGLSMMVILPISYFASQNHLWIRPDWIPSVSNFVFDILLLDLFIYSWHFTVHKIPLLWRFHEVHHLDEHLDTTSAIRFHFGEIFFATFARALVIIIFAVPFKSIVIFEILVLIFTLFHHSNMALPQRLERLISKIIVTPSIHWVHHHAIRKDTDSNYGTIFSFWDIIFSTKSETKRSYSMKIGVEKRKDKSFLRLILSPFTWK